MPTALRTLKTNSQIVSPLEFCLELQREHEAATYVEERKAKGQVFTPTSVSRFIASLFSHLPDECTLLDARLTIFAFREAA